MGQIAENKVNPTWVEDIYQIEMTDPVVGGSEGVANKQAKQLAERTQYLKKNADEQQKKLSSYEDGATDSKYGLVRLTDTITANQQQDDTAATAVLPKAVITYIAEKNMHMLKEINSIDGLRVLSDEGVSCVMVKSYYLGGQGGGGIFVWDATDTSSTDNNGTVIVANNGKRWKRVYTHLTPEDFGVKADGTDETERLQAVVKYAFDSHTKLVWGSGKTYTFTQLEMVGGGCADWESSGVNKARLHSIKPTPNITNYDADHAIYIAASYVGQTNVVNDVKMGYDIIQVDDISKFKVGDIIEIRSSRLIETDHRGQAREGQVCRIRKIVAVRNELVIDTTLNFQVLPYQYNGAVERVVSQTEFILPSDINRPKSRMLLKFTMTSGAAKGEVRYITDWDNQTKQASFKGRQNPFVGVKAGDTFVVEWSAYVTINRSPKVKLKGLHLYRDETLDASQGDFGFRGLDILLANEPLVEDFVAENFSDTGQRFRGCYRPTASRCESYGANRAYPTTGNPSDGTGYGFSEVQCYEARYIDCIAQRCRRGFDSGGTQQVSWGTKYINCEATGGGLTYMGVSFFPIGSFENSGMGTHGAGFNTEFINCRVYDMRSGYNHRGKNTIVRDCAQYGAANRCMTTYYAHGLRVDGFVYDDRTTSLTKSASSSINPIADSKLRAAMFMEIWCDQILDDAPLIIQNVQMQSARNYFVNLTRDGLCPDIYLGNCVVTLNNEGNDEIGFRWVNRAANISIGKIVEIAANKLVAVQTGSDGIRGNLGFETRELYPNGGYVTKANGAILAFIPPKTVLPIRTETVGMLSLDIKDQRADRDFAAVGIMLEQLSAGGTDLSPFAASNKKNVVLLQEKPTGSTSGGNKIGIVLRPNSDQFLYVENSYDQGVMLQINIS